MSRPFPALPLRLYLLGLGMIGCTLLVASCGKTDATFSNNTPGAGVEGGTKGGSDSAQMASGGVSTRGGSQSGGAGSSTRDGAGTGGGSGSAGIGGGAGGGAGGTAPGAGRGGAASGGASTGEAGAGGADAPLGVDCRDTHCVPGDVCVFCGADSLCVPHPVTEPEAYAKATATCEPAPYGYSECDGPEDCPRDQYCVAHDGSDGRQRCRSAPAPGFCCFTCDAPVDCTLCRDDSDCPDGESCSVVFGNLKGCTKK
jgi:hypothetical protein